MHSVRTAWKGGGSAALAARCLAAASEVAHKSPIAMAHTMAREVSRTLAADSMEQFFLSLMPWASPPRRRLVPESMILTISVTYQDLGAVTQLDHVHNRVTHTQTTNKHLHHHHHP